MTGSFKRQRLVEEFPEITTADLMRAAGGRRRFKESKYCLVQLPGGRVIRVGLVSFPGNYGGSMKYLVCPMCGCRCRTLRVVPVEPWLACLRDLRRKYGAKFASQLRSRTGREKSGLLSPLFSVAQGIGESLNKGCSKH